MTRPPTDRSDSIHSLGEPLRLLHERFDALIAPEREALWRYCHHLTGSSWDAEDLVQETLMKAFARLTMLWQPMQPRAWLFRVASNAWIDAVRRERRAEFGDLEELEMQSAGVDENLTVHVTDAMRRLVRLLPPRQRVVYLLTQTLDFQAVEVAAMLGTTSSAVKAALHRARETLARHSASVGEAGEAPTDVPTADPVVARYVAAFNARDPDAIAALLDEAAVTEIVGVAEEYGRAVTQSASLAEWAADPAQQWVEPGLLDGRVVLYVFHRTVEHPKALAWIIRLEAAGSRIHRQWQYYYCPELIRHAAARSGWVALTHGHRYVASEA
jgi:RNA polymerase sigma factor (sigma-70 family)